MRISFASLLLSHTLLHVGSVWARCDSGPCNDPRVLSLESSDCQQHHIFVARGSNSAKPGHPGELIRQVCEKLDDCGYEDLDYPADSGVAGPGAWCKSAHTGAVNGNKQLTAYNKRCPSSKLIVVGFSQGASVSLDYLGGGGDVDVFGCHQQENPSLDRTKVPGSKVAAVAVFGSTVRSAGQNYTVKGGQDFNGTSARHARHLAGLAPYSSVLREYCNVGDPICAHGSEPKSMSNHLNYFKKYTEEAAAWIVETTQKGTVSSATIPSPKSTESAAAAVSSPSSPRASSTAANSNGAPFWPISVTKEAGFHLAKGTWLLCSAVVFCTLFFFFVFARRKPFHRYPQHAASRA